MLSEKELTALAVSDEAVRLLGEIDRDTLADMLSDGFAAMKDYDQNNPHHCYDLLQHTLQTALCIRQDQLRDAEFAALRISALFHDVGKPRVAKAKGNKTVYYNHAAASERIARNIFGTIGFPQEPSEQIFFFIRMHDMFIGVSPDAKENESVLKSTVQKMIARANEKFQKSGLPVPSLHDYQLLMRLCRADLSAQSDEVYENGILINTKKQKLELIERIDKVINRTAQSV